MSETPSLAAILRMPASEAGDMMYALEEWVSTPERHGLPLDELPEPARMLLVFREMWSALDSSGMDYVLDWSVGEWFHETVKWARTIGAERTVAYFTEAAALFPRRRVPKDRQERVRLLRASDPGYDRLAALDGGYRERVLRELPSKLKAHLRENRASIERKLASPARRPAGSRAEDVVPYDNHLGDNIGWRVTLSRRYEAMSDAERTAEELPPEMVRIGDVVELRGEEGFCYVHATHPHACWRGFGPVCRVLPGVFAKPLSLAKVQLLVREPELFFHVVKVNHGLAESTARVVSHVDGPWLTRPFPVFRYDFGKTRDGRWAWKRWEGGDTGVGPAMIEPLSSEQRALFVFDPEEPQYLVARIAEGWRPADEVLNPDRYADV